MFFRARADLEALRKRSESSDPAHLRVRELHKSYGTHHVLKGLSFDVLRRKTNVLIGPSGSGKTVLMRQLIRLERPDAGQILLDEVDIARLEGFELDAIRPRFGMVFQMSALFDSMSVFDNVAFPLREHTRLRANELRDRVMARLADLGVDKAANKMPSELSGGMQKRVAVARALVMESEILIYDEPTTGLDPVTSRQVDQLIAETQERFSITSIVISHDMASVFSTADQIVYLYFGEVKAAGAPEEILDAEEPSLRRMIASSGIDSASIRKLVREGRVEG